jgi:hypothetical protein
MIRNIPTAISLKFGAAVKVDRIKDLLEDLLNLAKKQVLVGVPESTDAREDSPIGNAALAYIHDQGSPLANIPQREFMRPGIRKAQEKINKELFQVAKAYLEEDEANVDLHLHKAGLIAASSIKSVLNEGEGFAPLKRGTTLARLRQRKAAKKWDKEKREATMGAMHPLVNTGELRGAITYVVEDRK